MKFIRNTWNSLGSIFRPGGFWFNALFILLAAAVVGLGAWISFTSWEWLQDTSNRLSSDGITESNSTTLRNVGLLIGGALALVFALWRSLVAGHQADTSRRQMDVAHGQIEVAQQQARVAQQSLLNERYQKGAEMLSNEVLSVRLGGVYALQRLFEEDPDQYYLQIMDLLCAFVRFPTRPEDVRDRDQSNNNTYGWRLETREDIRPIVDIIRNRNENLISIEKKGNFTLNLHHAELPRANFVNADLARAAIHDANLFEAFLEKADLSDTYVMRTNLSRSYLWEANLSNAGLWGVNLTGAELWGANLSRAILEGANLSRAEFVSTEPLSNKRMPSVGLTQAQLDTARADPETPPILFGVRDAETGKPLVWRGKTLEED